jgi:hypothetical protein
MSSEHDSDGLEPMDADDDYELQMALALSMQVRRR